jgi:hypothetical protein
MASQPSAGKSLRVCWIRILAKVLKLLKKKEIQIITKA